MPGSGGLLLKVFHGYCRRTCCRTTTAGLSLRQPELRAGMCFLEDMYSDRLSERVLVSTVREVVFIFRLFIIVFLNVFENPERIVSLLKTYYKFSERKAETQNTNRLSLLPSHTGLSRQRFLAN